jgi:hypothetical protein
VEPEGSLARAAVRIYLLRSIRKALDDGLSADEWVTLIRERVPEAIEEAGERDLKAVVKLALGEQRARRKRRRSR